MALIARRVWPAVLVVALLAAAAGSPGGRRQLRESFTWLPTDYTELYFPADPVLTGRGAGTSVRIALGLEHHGRKTEAFTVRATVTTVGAGGVRAAEEELAALPGIVESTVLTVPVARPGSSYLVAVTLPGHPQTLHFRLNTKDGS